MTPYLKIETIRSIRIYQIYMSFNAQPVIPDLMHTKDGDEDFVASKFVGLSHIIKYNRLIKLT